MNIILIPKAVYRFSIIPKKILISFFTEIEIKNLKFMWNPNRSQIAKTILSKKRNFRPQDVLQSCRNNKQSGLAQNKRMCKPLETNKRSKHEYSRLIVDKHTKNIHYKKDNIFNKRYWENKMPTCRRIKLDKYLSHYTKE